MGLFNNLMHKSMAKEATRMAKEVKKLYAEYKSNNPSASEQEIIFNMAFTEKGLSSISEESANRIRACCESIQGFCYLIVLDTGKFKKMINLRSLQFTSYMDKALLEEGFPPQSKDQKRRILEAMNLAIEEWDLITKD